MYSLLYLKICTPSNTPATPPNFPDTLTLLSSLSANDRGVCSPPGPLSSPTVRQVGSTPPSQHVFSWPPADVRHSGGTNFFTAPLPVGSPSDLHARH